MLSSSHFPTSPLRVLALSPGIAVGPVRLFEATAGVVGQVSIAAEQVETEQQRLQNALANAISELDVLSERVAQVVGRSEADIFAAQQMMLEDPELVSEAYQLIVQQHLSASAAFQQVAELQARELASVGNEILAARAADIRDIAARVIRLLSAPSSGTPVLNEEPVILVANDLTPSDTATLNPETILGICTVVGGPTTHAAILARSLEIPAIAGLDPRVLESLYNGQSIALDGAQGFLFLTPEAEQEQVLREMMLQQRAERIARRRGEEAQWQTRLATTADGVPVQVFANVGDAESARQAGSVGAEGIGLLRTEFLFGGRAVFPDEQEQFESYLALFRAFTEHAQLGKTIVARTLDAGADKPFPALEPLIGMLQEANPALGLRGSRIHLVYEDLLRQQLRALLRAGMEAQITLHIMFPMITTLEEVQHLRSIYTAVRQELETEGLTLATDIQVGIMIETPAAVMMAEALVREVDFFSIGANDLFQYTMAADRTNSRVMSMFGVLEPAVWRQIEQVVTAAITHGKAVALCGELAADPRIAPLLAGLGVEELSMSPSAIVRVKAALHARPMADWQRLACELLKAETAAEMQAVLQSML